MALVLSVPLTGTGIHASTIPVSAKSQARAETATPALPGLSNWSRLRYTTNKLLIFSGDLTMTRSVSGDRTTVRTDSQARLFGSPFVESWSLSTMDRKTGRPLEFLDVRPGKKAERWRFMDDAVEHAVLKPHQGRDKDPVERWKVMKTEVLKGVDPQAPVKPAGSSATEREVSPVSMTGPASEGSEGGSRAPSAAASSRWIHDYISMIVRLKDLPLTKVGDEATVRVMTSRGPAPMRVRVGESRTTRRTIADLATGKSTRVEMNELRLRVTPLAGSSSDTRGFLNMEGETELWVDAATRTLTEISGNVPKVPGRVVITFAGYK